jgi:hypothetical protein
VIGIGLGLWLDYDSIKVEVKDSHGASVRINVRVYFGLRFGYCSF